VSAKLHKHNYHQTRFIKIFILEKHNFDTLREQLAINYTWPSVYMFKFIAPADNRIFALLHDLFPEHAEFTNRHSSGGKYVSITIKEVMTSVDEVISRYEKASAIEGVIAL
jgi:hypothetical protein